MSTTNHTHCGRSEDLVLKYQNFFVLNQIQAVNSFVLKNVLCNYRCILIEILEENIFVNMLFKRKCIQSKKPQQLHGQNLFPVCIEWSFWRSRRKCGRQSQPWGLLQLGENTEKQFLRLVQSQLTVKMEEDITHDARN